MLPRRLLRAGKKYVLNGRQELLGRKRFLQKRAAGEKTIFLLDGFEGRT